LFANALQEELHNKYDLISRTVVSENHNQPPSKKLPVNKSKEKEKETVTIVQNIDT
jgi:hypothetical protein